MTVGIHAPGPIGAHCAQCIYGPGPGEGTVVWFCRHTWSIVSAAERACAGYEPRNGTYTQPFFPGKVVAIRGSEV